MTSEIRSVGARYAVKTWSSCCDRAADRILDKFIHKTQGTSYLYQENLTTGFVTGQEKWWGIGYCYFMDSLSNVLTPRFGVRCIPL
jgi:hypothetical protein